MRTSLPLGLLLVGIALSGAAWAETKVGYLDVTRVAEESPQYAAARKSLRQELERRESELRTSADQLEKLQEKLKRDASVMGEVEVKKLERDILSRQRRLKNSQDEYREELSLRQNEERNKLLRQVAEVVKEIGKAEGYDLIITDGVAYFSKQVDISDKVLQRLKQKFGSR